MELYNACLLGAWDGTVNGFWLNSAPISTNENDVYTEAGDKINKASTETYLLELTPYKGLCIGVCLLNGQ